MDSGPPFQFDYTFDDQDRDGLLADARKTVEALHSELSDDPGEIRGAPSPGEAAALRLLEEFGKEVARFSAQPDVLELDETHFADHGMVIPPRFQDLRRQARFLWMRFPLVLKPADGTTFNKLQVGVEFNPGSQGVRPRALLILPDRKFQKALELGGGLELRIGENFEFEAAIPGGGEGEGRSPWRVEGGVDAKLAGQLGLVAGPFTYTFKKAVVDHTTPGAEQVFWTLTGTEFIRDDDPSFIVVLQVPNGVDKVEVAGALQAYHGFDVGGGTLGEALRFAANRVVNFFRAGAPARDSRVWSDVTAVLR
jgi:hypothetical protein